MEDLCKIRDVYRAIAEFETQFMQQYNLSLNEGMLLCTLLNTPRLTSGEIAEALGLTCSNTSKLIRSVEEKKLIARIIRFSMISILEETLEPPMIAVNGRLMSFNTLSTAFTSFSIK